MKRLLLLLLLSQPTFADKITVYLQTTGGHKPVGMVIFEDSQYGLMIKPNLSGLSVGQHGFHLHAIGSCAEDGMAAKGHFDPGKTGSHQGPFGKGHLGDLPLLYANKTGNATTPILAPRLKLKDIQGLAVMIHKKGDTYSDKPALGGGGARFACGVIGTIKGGMNKHTLQSNEAAKNPGEFNGSELPLINKP